LRLKKAKTDFMPLNTKISHENKKAIQNAGVKLEENNILSIEPSKNNEINPYFSDNNFQYKENLYKNNLYNYMFFLNWKMRMDNLAYNFCKFAYWKP